MSSSNKLVKNTFIYALGDIIPTILSLITFPILTSYLTPDDYGIVNYVNTINSVLTVLGLLSLNTYYLVYYFKCKTEKEKKNLLGNMFSAQVIFNLCMMVFLYALGPKIFESWGCKVDFYPYIAIGLICNFFNIIAVLPAAFYRVIENPLPLTIVRGLKGVLTMILVILFVRYYSASAISVMYVNLVVSVIFGIFFLYVIYKHATLKINYSQLKEALQFSLPILPGTLCHYLYSASDRILIEKYLTLYDLGIYSTAFTLAFILGILNTSAYQAFEPHFFKIYGKENFEIQFVQVRNAFLFVILSGALCLGVFSREFFIIFSSEKYHCCYLLVPIFLISAVFSGMRLMYNTIIVARGKTKISSMVTILGGCFSIIMNLILLPVTGLLGATCVSALTYTTLLLLSIYYSNLKVTHTRSIVSVAFTFSMMSMIVYSHTFFSLPMSILVKSIEIIVLIFINAKILNVDIKCYFNLSLKR